MLEIELGQANANIKGHERDDQQAKTVRATLEKLKGHLQNQLKNREAECSR